MQSSIKKRVLPSFCLSLFLHLLLLLSFSRVIFFSPPVKKDPPRLYVPSYVYKGGITPASLPRRQKVASSFSTASTLISHPKDVSRGKAINPFHSKSIWSLTHDVLQQNQREMVAHLKKDQDPIYLIGDKNNPADPLIRLLGHALSLHFEYPQEAGILGIKGRVLIGLTLHPDGHLTEVELLQSSDNQDLDAAALYAVNNAPIIHGVNQFLKHARHFVVGFHFT